MFTQRLTSATHYAWRSLTGVARKVRALRERYKAINDLRECRGLNLLREWLSAEQRAQFDRSRCFDVVGCDTGTRYRISYKSGTNVHQLNAAGQLTMGWCFVPSGHLVPGDVMLAQKIALETDERAALAVANKFPVHVPFPALPRRAY